jgi:hypothetical protein
MDVMNSITSPSTSLTLNAGYVGPLAALPNNVIQTIAVVGQRTMLSFYEANGAPLPYSINSIQANLTASMVGSGTAPLPIDCQRLYGLSDPAAPTALEPGRFFLRTPTPLLLAGALPLISGQPQPDNGFSTAPNVQGILTPVATAVTQPAFSNLEAYTFFSASPDFSDVIKGNIQTIGVRWSNSLRPITPAFANMLTAMTQSVFNLVCELNIVLEVPISTLANGSLAPTYALTNVGESVGTASLTGFASPVAAAVNALNSVVNGKITATSSSQAVCRITSLGTASVGLGTNSGNIQFPVAGGLAPNPSNIVVSTNVNIIAL